MDNLFTIGFTQKKAETFFTLLQSNHITTVIDIRLNNTSQLSGFAKYPDIEFFLEKISNIAYIHDKTFAPAESTLKRFKKKDISWEQYVFEFNKTMVERNIESYIYEKYKSINNACLLCSEPTADYCHRSLIADRFKLVFDDLTIKHI